MPLYLEVGTPAEYEDAFLRSLDDIRGGRVSEKDSKLPPGVTLTPEGGLTGTPTDLSDAPYSIVYVDAYNNKIATLSILEGEPTVPPVAVEALPPTVELEVGVGYVIDMAAGGGGSAYGALTSDPPPPGLTLSQYGKEMTGVPVTAGDYPMTLEYIDMYGDPLRNTETISFNVTAAVVTIPVPAAQRTDDGYMLPDIEGVIWTVDDVETLPGSYSVLPVAETTTVTILPTTDDGYVFDAEPEPLVLTFEPDPEPEPEPEPDPGPFDPAPAPPEPDESTEATWARLMDDDPQAIYVATKLAERIIRHTGQDVADLEPSKVLTARDHAMTVLEYVKGYTRDRGFIGYVPHRSLQAVIVNAGGRLFVNPEQLTYYSTGDYSERPATMTGWTHAELSVLRRFRRTYQ